MNLLLKTSDEVQLKWNWKVFMLISVKFWTLLSSLIKSFTLCRWPPKSLRFARKQNCFCSNIILKYQKGNTQILTSNLRPSVTVHLYFSIKLVDLICHWIVCNIKVRTLFESQQLLLQPIHFWLVLLSSGDTGEDSLSPNVQSSHV